ncbi:MAG: ATP-binding protein [Acidimicrobiales bacterium]
MLTNLNFRTRLGAMITSSLIVSAGAALAALVLTAAGATTIAAVVAVIALVAVAGCTFMASASIGETATQIDDVVAVAEELTDERLPRLANSVLEDSDLDGFEPFPGASSDGMGQVVTALNSVQAATRELVLQQRTQVREGVSNLVVNLVRRNQGLLERQLDHIDKLESSEEDPDRLEELYGVDHLASRMRRNAESLLVLAGLDPQRRKGDPISINDLMRVAMGEIEGYQNVRISRVDDGEVPAQAALDIAHLLSELLENATQFSPPTATVEMAGAIQPDGAYLISIADQGIGMSQEQLADYNELLVDPPELSLSLGRSLGFLVVSRLAQRLGLTVEITATRNSAGITALVLVPEEIMNGQSATRSTSSPSRRSDDSSKQGASPTEAPPAATSAVPSSVRDASSPTTVGTSSAPTDDDDASWIPPTIPDRGSGGLGGPEIDPEPAAAPQAEAAVAPAQEAETAPSEPEPASEEPVQSEALAKLLGVQPADDAPNTEMPQRLEEAIPSGDNFDAGVAGLLTDESPPGTPNDGMPAQRTSKGLAKRDRSKSQAPIGEGRVIPDAGAAPVTASSRDPEEIRDMLARYRKAREGANPDGAPDGGDIQ